MDLKKDKESIKKKERSNPAAHESSESSQKGLAIQPPTFQLKTNQQKEKNESGDTEQTVVDSPYQFSTSGDEVNPGDENQINEPYAPKSLPKSTQTKMESSFGQDFSNVNIYDNSKKATDIKAQAYTQGNEIGFAPGKYNPQTSQGQELIGHELTHVVQQRQNKVKATSQAKGLPLNDDPTLEKEADILGAKAAQGNIVQKKSSTTASPGSEEVIQGFFGGISERVSNTVKKAKEKAAKEKKAAEDALEEKKKQKFKEKFMYGPKSLAHTTSVGSGVGVGGFEATYFTYLQLLNIRVKGKIKFVDAVTDTGGALAGAHTQLNSLATYLTGLPKKLRDKILPFYQWNDDSKKKNLALYQQRLQEAAGIWQNAGHYFEVNDPKWSDIRAYPLFNLQVSDEGTIDSAKDHLQIRVFKSPTKDEIAQINAILKKAKRNKINAGIGNLRAYAGSNMGGSGSGTDENPFNNEMALSSNDLSASKNDKTRGGNHMLKKSVMFGYGKKSLTNSQKNSIKTFINSYSPGDTNAANNAIKLVGYASASGSTESNKNIVDERIKAVRDYIIGIPIPAARITTENKSNTEAKGLKKDRKTQKNERRVEILIGSGERQNTVAHEFGHVFGLSDEYAEGARAPGNTAWQDKTVKEAGIAAGSQIENSDNIISVGNTVRPQHYATFAWALNQLTDTATGGKKWHVKT